jgi:signal peptidase
VLLCLAWLNFAPNQFGGLSSYVIVAGASMEPTLQRGDLVLVRDESDYQVGDVVTYKHPQVGPVIHRIIETEGNRFILQGDNNNWIDSYTPTEEEVIGKQWLHIPEAGDIMSKLRSPIAMALLALILGIGLFSKFGKGESSDQHPQGNGSRKSSQPLSSSNIELDSYIFVASAIFISALILGIVAFRQPLKMTVSDEIPYDLNGTFSYSAKAPSGIYDSDSAVTGDPIYLGLSKEMSVQFSFELTGNEISDANGTILMNAVLSDPHGWSRTIILAPGTTFSGYKTDVMGNMDLSSLLEMISTLEEQTGFARSEYSLTILPTVVSEARINGGIQLDEFSPQLTFRLDRQQLYLKSSETGVPDNAQLTSSEMKFYTFEREVPNEISILGIDFVLELARWISSIGLMISLVAFAAISYSFARTARRGEAAIINLRYGGMIVDIRKGMRLDDQSIVEVGKFDDLVRFAERGGVMILHEYRWRRHVYYVQDGATLYRYKPTTTTRQIAQQRINPGTNGKGKHSPGGDSHRPPDAVSKESIDTQNWGRRIQARVKDLVTRISGGPEE